jgi:hypothetical protein
LALDIARNVPTGNIYVANQVRSGSGWASSANIYPVGSRGDTAPIGVISGPLTQLGEVNGIIVDAMGEVYVANSDTSTIVGFAPNSTGNVSPNIVIGGSQTGLSHPVGITFDKTANIYVANCGAGCPGGLAPTRSPSGLSPLDGQVRWFGLD